MTCLEKLLEAFPKTMLANSKHDHPPFCPHHIGLSDESKDRSECYAISCSECWSKEVSNG